MFGLLLSEGLHFSVAIPQLDDLFFDAANERELVVPPLDETEQPDDEAGYDQKNHPVEQSFLKAREIRIVDIYDIFGKEFAIGVIACFVLEGWIVVFAGGDVGRELHLVVDVSSWFSHAADQLRLLYSDADIQQIGSCYDNIQILVQIHQFGHSLHVHLHSIVDCINQPGVHIVGVDFYLPIVSHKENEGLVDGIGPLGAEHGHSLHWEPKHNLVTLVVPDEACLVLIGVVVQLYYLLALLV